MMRIRAGQPGWTLLGHPLIFGVLGLLFTGVTGCSSSGTAAPLRDIPAMSLEEFTSWQQITAFVAAGGDVNRSNSQWVTPLHDAVGRRQLQVAMFLLAHGADVNSMTGMVTPIQIAVSNADPAMLELLIAHHADVNLTAYFKRLPQAEEEIRKQLMATIPDGVRWKLTSPWPNVPRTPPLAIALDRGRVEMARLLLKNGAKIRNEAMVYGFPPLHDMVHRKKTDLVKLLLDYGEDVNGKADESFSEATPLHVAGQAGNLELVRLLTERGADVTARTKDGETPLALALKGRGEEGFGTLHESDPGNPRRDLDESHKAVVEYLRAHGGKE